MAKGKKGKKKRHAPADVAALKFSGGRYEARGFPLDGIDELEKYQRMVLEAAKLIWRQKNPDAKRLPDNFPDRVRLRLTQIDKGSVVPVIERETQIPIAGAPDILELSIDYIDDTFASIVESVTLPDDITDELKSLVRLFGVSFEGKERATFRDGSSDPVVYTVEKRDALRAALKIETATSSGTLVGTIRMLDTTQEFILNDANGTAIKGQFSQSTIFDELHELHHLRDEADLVWIEGTFEVDPDTGSVTKVSDVARAGQFAKSTNPGAQRLAALATLPEGWLDGDGKRVELLPLLAALRVLDAIGSGALPVPSIFAGVDGGVRLEWLTSTSHTSLSADDEAQFDAYHLNIATGEEDEAEGLAPDDALDFARGYIVE